MTWRQNKFNLEASGAIKKVLTGPNYSRAQQFWGTRHGGWALLPPAVPSLPGKEEGIGELAVSLTVSLFALCDGNAEENSWSSCSQASVHLPAMGGEGRVEGVAMAALWVWANAGDAPKPPSDTSSTTQSIDGPQGRAGCNKERETTAR